MSEQEQNPQSAEEQSNIQHETEVMPSLEELLQEAERKAQEHYDAWMYAKAEGENIRRRAHEDIDKAQCGICFGIYLPAAHPVNVLFKIKILQMSE